MAAGVVIAVVVNGGCRHSMALLNRDSLSGRHHLEAEAALDVLAVLHRAQPQVLHHHRGVVLANASQTFNIRERVKCAKWRDSELDHFEV